MSEKGKNFHSFALESSLFKGHSDWYFCYLKSERIAHVLTILIEHSDHFHNSEFRLLLQNAYALPASIAHLCAGELDLANVLAEIFSLATSIRFLATGNTVTKENARLIVEEYEALAEKLDAGTRLSPFVTSEDFIIAPMQGRIETSSPRVSIELVKKTLIGQDNIKDIKGQSLSGEVARDQTLSKGQQERLASILNFVQVHKSVSIKDIRRLAEQLADPVVKNCSEKTIQRELTELIRRGLVRRVGKRRWSMYEPIFE